MPVYISDDLVTALAAEPGDFINPNSPRIGIENLSNKSNITTLSTTLATNPGWLTATPSTAERWKSGAATYHVWIAEIGGQVFDYVGIAAHRGLVGQTIEIAYKVGAAASVIIYGPKMVTRQEPIFIIVPPVGADQVFVRIYGLIAFEFEIGIINVGNTVALPRNIYVDHTPINLGRKTSRLVSNSDNGQFLGQISLKSSTQSAVAMSNIPPDYYRTTIYERFSLPAETLPFFWAWRPYSYPNEVGFCWLNDDVNVNNSMANGYMSMNFSMTGTVNNG